MLAAQPLKGRGVVPPGSTVLASSDAATVSIDTTKFGPNPPVWAAMGCVRADGRERVLASYSLATEGSSTVTGAVLGGTLAALEFGQLGVGCAPSITVYNLQTGKTSDYYDDTSCGAGINPLLLEASGFAAWLVSGSDESEQLYAHDDHGTRVVDSAPAGSGTAIGHVHLIGERLTWTHDGTPHELALQ